MSWQAEAWLVDISHHQGKIDFAALEANGCAGVIVKATEGRDHVDPRFRENWQGAAALPFRGVYHYARIDTDHADPLDAAREAQHFAKTVGSLDGAGVLPPWVDFEWFGSLGRDVENNVARNLEWAELWVETCERELGRSPGPYTGADVWADRWRSSGRLSHLPLWQADHASPAGQPEPMRVPSWRPSIHQFTARAHVPGITARVDANVVAVDSDVSDLQARRVLAVAELTRLSKLRLIPRLPPRTSTSIMPTMDLASLAPSDVSEAVAVLQGVLLGRGFDPGKIDGKAGPKTRAALSSFRQASGMAAGTEVDGATWHALLAVKTSFEIK